METVQWAWPPQSGVTYTPTTLRTKIFEFLLKARNPYNAALGERSALFDDEVEFRTNIGGIGDPTLPANITMYCLPCDDYMYGEENWEACRYGKTRIDGGLWNQTFIFSGDPDPYYYRLPELPAQVASAICTFGIDNTDSHNLTIAFPFINRALHAVRLRYSSENPMGSALDGPSRAVTTMFSTSTSTSTSTTTSTGYPTSTRVPYDYGLEREMSVSPGTIAGICMGVMAAFVIFYWCVKYRKETRGGAVASRNVKPTTAQRQERSNAQNEVPLDDLVPTRRPPEELPSYARDDQSRAERGEAGEAIDLPPPAYEQVVADAARQAGERERQDAEQRDLEIAIERSREDQRASGRLTPWEGTRQVVERRRQSNR